MSRSLRISFKWTRLLRFTSLLETKILGNSTDPATCCLVADFLSSSLRVDWQTANIARSHYTRHFGPMNGWVPVSNHTFVILDAPGMAEEDYQRAEKALEYDEWEPKPDGAIEFIKSISASQGRPSLSLTIS